MLQRELAGFEDRLSIQKEEIQNLNRKLRESANKLSSREVENESLRRQVERSDSENEELLQKFDSACKSLRIHEGRIINKFTYLRSSVAPLLNLHYLKYFFALLY